MEQFELDLEALKEDLKLLKNLAWFLIFLFFYAAVKEEIDPDKLAVLQVVITGFFYSAREYEKFTHVKGRRRKKHNSQFFMLCIAWNIFYSLFEIKRTMEAETNKCDNFCSALVFTRVCTHAGGFLAADNMKENPLAGIMGATVGYIGSEILSKKYNLFPLV